MAPSSYDVNVQLTLAITAEQEGDLTGALAFLADARRLAPGTDRLTRARVLLHTARVRIRALTMLRPAHAF